MECSSKKLSFSGTESLSLPARKTVEISSRVLAEIRYNKE
jgi:hypothetical protein